MATEETGELIKLPAVLDLSAAEGFLGTMLRASEAGVPLRLDVSAVETLTMPCVQIILAARRGGDNLSIENPSAAFLAAFTDLGLPWIDAQADGNMAAVNTTMETATDEIPTAMEDTDMAKRVLTIDDSKTMRDMLMLTLSDAGYDVIQAIDGQDGIDVLGDDKVDVVITDINMPKMDGYEVIRNLRSNPTHKSTPILVLTTESDTEKKNLARDAGATGWMVKPFDPDQLVATIRKVSP
jgi:two-component system chemotaxis response regulator CheY